MPQKKPGSAPDQPSTPSWSAPPKVWETGETPDESRVPGTRRLWLAGALAVAVLVASVTAIALQERSTDDSARDLRDRTTSADEPLVPEASIPPAPPRGKSGLSSPQPTASATSTSSESQQGGAKPEPKPEPSKSATSSKPPASSTSSSRKSVQSVNYPDRYWHVDDGVVRLDRVGSGSSDSTQREASFKVVRGLADSDCYSFSAGDGRYLRHDQFLLRSQRDDGSKLFEQDATFCPRRSFHSGAVMLESVNYPGRFLRHKDFVLRLDPVENNQVYWLDTAFRLVKAWA